MVKYRYFLYVCLIIAKHNNVNYKYNVFIGAGQLTIFHLINTIRNLNIVR